MSGFTFSPELTVGDALTFLGLLIATVGVAFAGYELRQSVRAHRASFLLEATRLYFSDPEVRQFYYKLDYHQFIFDRNFQGSDDERLLDSLIYSFDVVGRLVRTGVLPLEDARILAFQTSRVIDNDEVQGYLAWLDDEYHRFGKRTPAHEDARWLADALRYADNQRPTNPLHRAAGFAGRR